MDMMELYGIDEDELDDEEIELLGEVLGLDDAIIGARRRRRGGRRGGSRRMRRAALKQALVPKTPGVPTPGGRQQPLGYSPVQFTDASALILELVANPDRPFKGFRLVIVAVRSAAGIGGLLTLRRFDIGGKNQIASREPIVLDAFAHDATLVELALDPLTPGVPSVIEVQASVQPTTAATVDIGAALFGPSIS